MKNLDTPECDDVTLRLADYCCRCGKLFGQGDPISLLATSDKDEAHRRVARPVHRDACVSPEDVVLMLGYWQYASLDASRPSERKR